jgi:mono/diheme cytochrome c family protein
MTGVLLVLLGLLLLRAAAPAEAATDLYATHCAVCHGRTGKGDGPALDLPGWKRPGGGGAPHPHRD